MSLLYKNIIKVIKTPKGLFKRKSFQRTIEFNNIDCSDLIWPDSMFQTEGAVETYAVS